jgi:hypothetical protein
MAAFRASALLLLTALAAAAAPAVIVFNDDGGWNWLQDPRVVVAAGRIFAGSVATGGRDPDRAGNVEVACYDPAAGAVRRSVLHHAGTPVEKHAWKEDHNAPALLAWPDGRVLAVYALHGVEAKLYLRSWSPGAGSWSAERTVMLTPGSRAACPNLAFLPGANRGQGRLFCFFRGLGSLQMPSWISSDDRGETWSIGGSLLKVGRAGPGAPDLAWGKDYLPYAKYAADADSTIHLVYNLGHQSAFGNALFDLPIRDGRFPRDAAAGSGTRIFQAGPDDVAWICGVEVDDAGRPFVGYAVQKNLAGRPNRGADHRYRLARWTGAAWSDHEIAFAGSRVHLVPGDSCTGLIALDPRDSSCVVISTDADPRTGLPLLSAADGRRHWEIFQGATADGGRSWSWTALTRDSAADNIRPVVPRWGGPERAVLWLRGTMRMPDDYHLSVLGEILPRSESTPSP